MGTKTRWKLKGILNKDLPSKISAEDFNKLVEAGSLVEGKGRTQFQGFGEKPQRKNKYGAIKKEYNGRVYDSTGEADYAAQLDLIKETLGIKKIIPQYRIELKVEDVHICYYYVDFKIVFESGKIEFHEFKGKETNLWKNKWKMTKAKLSKIEPKSELVLIKRLKGKFVEVERFLK